MDTIIKSLEERAKELNCLYSIEEILNSNRSTEEIIYELLTKIPNGMKYPQICMTKITIADKEYTLPGFHETEWVLNSNIKVHNEVFGTLNVYYWQNLEQLDEGPFYKEEKKLLKTIAERFAHYLFFNKMKEIFDELSESQPENNASRRPEWMVILDMLKRTDQNLFSILSRKMLNHLYCKGIKESHEMFEKLGSKMDYDVTSSDFLNRPTKKTVLQQSFKLGNEIFELASQYFSDNDIMQKIQKWINEEKSHHLVKLLANQNSPLADIADAIRKYHQVNPTYDLGLTPTRQGIRVALIRRFLNDQLEFIDIAKNYLEIEDFYFLFQKMIFPPESHGKLGGKGSGLLLARKIIEKASEYADIMSHVKFPKTWYITSDGLMNFMYYNNMEDVIEQKYRDIEEIRQEYPHIMQAFKNSQFSSEILNGLSRALDDFSDNPIIVRSSSLLEDRMGSAFAGKYKSLFLANQGTKQQRLDDLVDAIAEVYASTFGPDPIGYRTEKGLLDFNEEMGILIQEVVGKRVGQYFFPAFAGVAFSNNEFRWSPRIKREDGLIRMVPGLGTRAVDRVSQDFPLLIAPGRPDLKVNQTYMEIVGYSPKFMDVINLETNTFETITIKQLLKEVGNRFPMINDIFSIVEERRRIIRPIGLGIDTKKHDIVVTFDNLVHNKKYIEIINSVLVELKEKLGTPVDIEFACDGTDLYLLQCRPQSSASEALSAVIPKDVAKEKILFTANKFVSNGKVPDIAHIVYVDPDNYAKTESLAHLMDVGATVSKLNKLLPKKTFILMGPGRWGTRDDIRLGVKITYSDIHNTAVLIEVAQQKENYIPDLSFGTHFFQDLVEAGIRYLPLYPGDKDVIFNRNFFMKNSNTLTRYAPEYEHLSDVVRVINVRESTGGAIVRILMNADEDFAMAIITDPTSSALYTSNTFYSAIKTDSSPEEALQWRKRMVESVALKLEPERFGIIDVYLYGTVFNDTASSNSDIDLLVIHNSTTEQLNELKLWFEGWNNCLSQLNYNRSGFSIEKFLDITYISQKDLKDQKYYADLIEPANKMSRKLKLKQSNPIS